MSALRVEQRGSVRWVLLSRPERRNALDDELTDALRRQVDDVDGDPATSAVVIAGEGAAFCAGGDFRQFLSLATADAVVDFLSRVSECVSAIAASPKPWIAAVHGHAIAGGLEIALACDVVIAAEGSLIGDGHVNNRLLPAAGSAVRLERAVGKSMARWMHLSGEPQRAETLAARGWVHSVVPADRLRAQAQEVAERLTARHPGAQQNMKRLLNAIDDQDEPTALRAELEAFGANWVDSEVADALADFLAHRGTTHRTA